MNPSHAVRRFVSVSKGLIPTQDVERSSMNPSCEYLLYPFYFSNPLNVVNENFLYDMFVEKTDNEEDRKTTGYPHIASNSFTPVPSSNSV